MIGRLLNLSKNNSFFLFGARGTGKSTLLKEHFSSTEHVYINLLDRKVFATLQAYPEKLIERFPHPDKDRKNWIVIDEVQKIPALLDIVHDAIESRNLCFALSGSSARKLKRGGANLLAGRAFSYRLFPFLWNELGDLFATKEAVQWGTLPKMISFQNFEDKSAYLQSYCETYLQEEIIEEQIIRNLPPFRKFLHVAALANAQIVNYAKIAEDVLTDPSNIKNYFQILEDTLLGFFLEPFHLSIRKRQKQSPKFYWFDTGVVRALAMKLDLPVDYVSFEYGFLFESFIISQIRASLIYSQKQFQLSFLKTKDHAEIDLIIERAGQPTYAIEIKSGDSVKASELNSLVSLSRDIPNVKAICLYDGNEDLIINSIPVLPWRKGMTEILN